MTDAFHLPALSSPPTTTWEYGEGETALTLRVPQLTPALLGRQIEALLRARSRHLDRRPAVEIARSIGAVADRLLDRSDPLRVEAERVLPAVTGSSPSMVGAVLDGMAADWREDRLIELLQAEFGDPGRLDGFRPAQGDRLTRATGPRLTTHVFSGNVPGVAVTSLVRALLVKSASIGKVAVGEPVLAPLFARGLSEVDPDLGACLAITYWPGGEGALERLALEASDAVIVYGSGDAVEAIRSRTPAGARFLGYGHRISFGVVARESLTAEAVPELARSAGRDVALFDQQGCVSPHLFYAEEGGAVTPRDWARGLAVAMAELEGELPRGGLSPGEATAIRQLRAEIEFGAISGGGLALHASPGGTAWTVIYDPDPTFTASCLNRVVRIKPVSELGAVPGLVRDYAPVLQSVGLAGPRPRLTPLAEELAAIGVSRLAPLGSMAWPRPTWHHDGRPPLSDLVRWCDWETSSRSFS